ncbi:MAG: hypothetical protein K1Y01_19775 [Vicinamibacteria bacterium]|nr:hypothetical protein [Vicinamibacteria bacterium]
MVMFAPGALDRDPRLGQALRRVRARYSLRVLFRGAAILALGVILGVAASAYGLEALRYSRNAVWVIRALLYLWIVFLAARFVLVPLWRGRRRASDAAIARYIEEHEPSLDAALRSAVDAVAGPSASDGPSAALQEKLVDDVVSRLEAFDLPREVDRVEIRRALVALGAAAAAAAAFFLLAPAFMQQAFPYLFDPFSRSGRGATPYRVAVTPGNQTVARGSDQEITAQLLGFDDPSELVTRAGASEWTRSPMIRDESSQAVTYRFMLLSVMDATEYFVESKGTRSEVFRLDVVDRPYVKKVDLEYRFPAYARLEPQRVEGSGDVTVLSGSSVVLAITPTVAVKAGRLVIQGEEAKPVPLEVAAGGLGLSGQMRVTRDGFYRIEMQGADESFAVASPDYVIEVVPDLPPRLAFDRPGRDTQATPIEEVFTQVKAEDDFGVAKMELVYSLNGGAETVVPLHDAPVLKEVVASHTFFLEDLSLKPGDFISYYARATDVGSPGRQATTDIYFLEARPYRRDFRQAEQAGGGGGGGGSDPGSLSQQQRQVIAATFRLIRDQTSKDRDARSLTQDARTVALIQGRLRTQVETLVTRMLSRGALPDGSPMHGTADELRQAIEKMTRAEAELTASRPGLALPIEQGALAHLQRAEASFHDVQVAFGGGGGGGDGASNSSAEELADLYELDLDKLRNQYETLQSGAAQQRDEQVDEALSRLQELARRQEQENERARQRGARTPNQGGGGGGASQRQLADEAEELGRKLERLTRETPAPALEESARRLREAASAMRQQASSPRGQSAPSGANSPLDRLREARRLLDTERSTRLERDLSGFSEKAEAIKRAQAQIAGEMREMAQAEGTGAEGSPAQGGSPKGERIRERKESLAAEVAELESRLDKVARDARREQKETSRKLQEAANGIRDSKLKEKIRYSRGLVDRAASRDAQAFEADIAGSIDDLGARIREAGKAVGAPPERKRAEALDRARDLARSLDSMQERLRARSTSKSAGGVSDPSAGEAAEGSSPGGTQPSGAAGTRGTSAAGGRPGAGGVGRLGPGDIRQLRSEIAERASDAEAFRKLLEASGVSSPQAAALADRLRGLASERNFKDPLGLADLTAQVANDLKMLEYVLRREADGNRPTLQLSGSEDLPPGYRAMVEEYYRTLGKKPQPR